jgi:hypothetical protein
MIILDKPYVSDFLLETIKKYNIPVLKTDLSEELLYDKNKLLITEEDAILHFKNNSQAKLYTNSENSIAWIENKLDFTDLPKKINIFKDKYRFRELVKPLFPDYFFKSIHINELESTDVSGFPLPFILKPSIGFFSLGIYKINAHKDWGKAVSDIKKEMIQIEGMYPKEVLNTTKFIVEECIKGEEYALDCYYDNNGNPVILNVLKHLFASENDTGDRIYFTSAKVLKEQLKPVEDFLSEVGKLTKIKNFPVHIELRIKNGKVQPIEFNPLRFGGWCSTADLTAYAWNINSYDYFLSGKKPDWKQILKNDNGHAYNLIVLDNNSGIAGKDIKRFDYDKLLKSFTKPLELRKTDYKKFPVFAFLFAKTDDENAEELKNILKSDLREYISV